MKIIHVQIGNGFTQFCYRDIENTLKAKQDIVGGLIEPICLGWFNQGKKSYSIDLVCNEEGKLLNLHPSCVVRWDSIDSNYDIICGECFIALCDTDKGEYVSMPKWLFDIISNCLINTKLISFFDVYKLLDVEATTIDKAVNDYVGHTS